MPAPAIQALPVDSLVLDAGTQSRVAVNEDTVDEYAEILEAAGGVWPFPPIVVYHDGNRYLVAAGFHRTLAALRAKRNRVPCEVRQGTAWDALIFGMADNHEHGLRPTREDRRRNVEILLTRGENLLQQQVADFAGVSLRTVRRVASEMAERTTPRNRPLSSEQSSVNRPLSSEQKPVRSVPDPFDVDEGAEGEDGRREADGQDAPRETAPPAAERSGREALAGDERLKIQRSKTVKTAEALMRAFDDLQAMKKGPEHGRAIAACQRLVQAARNW